MNVLLLSPISPEAMDFIRSNHSLFTQFESSAGIPWDRSQTEVVIIRSGPLLDRSFLEMMPRLRAIIRSGAGIDNIDTEYLERMSIPLYQITDHHANAVAELAFGLFLDLARNITHYDRTMREGVWKKGSRLGMEIRGKVMGIVGLGRIGMRLAELSRGWDMKVLGVVRNFSNERRDKLRSAGVELVRSLYELPARADLIAVTLPLSETTRSLIETEFISQMKKTALLVNVGRGATIDDDALFDALLKKNISGAALDVHNYEGFQSRFSKLKNVILTPHIGSLTIETQILIGREVIKRLTSIERDLKNKNSPGVKI